jgi:hypothetical protein
VGRWRSAEEGATLVSHASEADLSGEDEVEKAVEASRGATTHKIEGGGWGGLGLNPNFAPLYIPRLELDRARQACQTGWALTGQAAMPWAGPVWGQCRKAWTSLQLLFLVIFYYFILFFLVDQIKF